MKTIDIRKAFLTGSRRYGTPTDKSDIDLVVLTSASTILDLLKFTENVKEDACDNYGAGTAQLKFGKLNLILVSETCDFDIWLNGTRQLAGKAKKKPVTRKQAVAHFKKLREQARQ